MAIMEKNTLDTAAIIMQAYEIGDLINSSVEVSHYLFWKNQVENSPEAQAGIREFEKCKQLFDECQRFGHYHPEYHASMEMMNSVQHKLAAIDSVKNFKQAEEQLDELLFAISQTIAYSVSDKIKVPSNNPLLEGGDCSTGSCGTGGCSGKCG